MNSTSHQEVINLLYLCHTRLLFLPPDLCLMNSPAKMEGGGFSQHQLQPRKLHMEAWLVLFTYASGVPIVLLCSNKDNPNAINNSKNIYYESLTALNLSAFALIYAFICLLVVRIILSNKNISISDLTKISMLCRRGNFGK